MSAGSVLIELAAMLTLFPLLSVVGGRNLPEDSFVVRVLVWAHLQPDERVLLLVFIFLFTLRVISQFAGQALTQYLSKRLLLELGTGAFYNLVRSVPLKDIERETIGAYISLVGDESFRASTIVSHLNQLVSLALLAVLYIGAVFLYSPSVGIGVIIFLVVTFALMIESFRMSHRLGVRQVDQSQSSNSLFLDAINGLRSVRSFGAEDYVATSYLSQMSAYIRTLVSIDLISLATRLAPALLLLLAAGIVASSQTLSASLSLDFPFLLTIVILLMRFFPVAGQALSLALRVIADARAGRDVTHLIGEQYVKSQNSNSLGSVGGVIESLEVHEVTFSYEEGKLLLKDVDFVLQRGKSYALGGLSGSGKSTLLDILMGFYEPVRGGFRLNGLPAELFTVKELRQRIVLVSQDTTIFNDTIANNVRFGLDAPIEKIEHACRIACIHDFIAGLPQGYETVLSYRGTNLSGGQKQRIGLARAIIRSPDVLLLDESTSALDMETRDLVVASLLSYAKDRIVLFVTHDRRLMSQVDIVLDMGLLNRAASESAFADQIEKI